MKIKTNNFIGGKSYTINPCHVVQQNNKKELKEIIGFFETGQEDDIKIGYDWLCKLMNSTTFAKVNTLVYTLMKYNGNQFNLDENNYWKIEELSDYENGIKHLHCHVFIDGIQRVFICADFPNIAIKMKIPHILTQDELIRKTMQSTPIYPYGLINWNYIKNFDSKR